MARCEFEIEIYMYIIIEIVLWLTRGFAKSSLEISLMKFCSTASKWSE